MNVLLSTRDNEIGSWSLDIADATHNHPPTLPDAHPIHWQLARTDKVKELIRVGRTNRGGRASRVDRGGGVRRADKEGRVSRIAGVEELVELIKLVGFEGARGERNRSVTTNRTRVEEAKIVETEIAGVVKATKEGSQVRLTRNIVRSLGI